MKKGNIIWFICIILISLVAVYNNFFLMKIEIVGTSMLPNYTNGQEGYADKLFYKAFKIKRFDVVILDINEKDELIKRVVGLPNEKIQYINNNLYVNDKLVEEDFIDASSKYCTCNPSYTLTCDFCTNPIVLKENEYFVLGDNRNVSKDSRVFGIVNYSNIVARVMLVK